MHTEDPIVKISSSATNVRIYAKKHAKKMLATPDAKPVRLAHLMLALSQPKLGTPGTPLLTGSCDDATSQQ